MMAAQTQQYPIQQQQPVQQVQSPNGQIKQAAQQQQGAPSPSESRKLRFNELNFPTNSAETPFLPQIIKSA